MIPTIYFEGGAVFILNQSLLPGAVEYERIVDHKQLAQAIKTLKVRGAPLIGVAAAFGLALTVINYTGSRENLAEHYLQAEKLFASTRPTAVNLCWAINRMNSIFKSHQHEDLEFLRKCLLEQAQSLCEEDRAANKSIGEKGQVLLPPNGRILTICNAGALATCGYGTALGVIRAAHERGKVKQVWVCETRPVLQGARLTVWELMQDKIPATLITDNMAGYLMSQHKVDTVVTGADRIAANGDAANKIGTYSLAVLAKHHHLPFYIAAPWSTIDMNITSGQAIPIEERNGEEVRQLRGQYITVPEVEVYNPAFDVTPGELISGIITEAGVITPPYGEGLLRVRRS